MREETAPNSEVFTRRKAEEFDLKYRKLKKNPNENIFGGMTTGDPSRAPTLCRRSDGLKSVFTLGARYCREIVKLLLHNLLVKIIESSKLLFYKLFIVLY